MRRSVPLFCLALATLGACTGGARLSRGPGAAPTTPGGLPVDDAPRTPAGGVATERMVSVPSLVGLDLEAAAERAHAAGLELMALRVPGTPAGLVLEQNPSAGRAVPEGAPLSVRIASGNATGAMPVGPSGQGAGPQVPPAPPPDLPPSVVPEAPVAATPEGSMPETPPAAGQPGDILPIPSVLDRTEPVARRILFDAGFRVRIEPTESGVTGRVMDQLPSPGDRVPRGTEIVLKVPGYVPSPEVALGSPDAAPEGTLPSTAPATAVPAAPEAAVSPPAPAPEPPPTPPAVAAEPPASPPAIAVEPPPVPPVDEVPVPIFAGPPPVAGSPPAEPAPLPAVPAPPEGPPAAMPPVAPLPPEAPPAPADLSVPPESPAAPAPAAPPIPEAPPAPPSSDALPVPPSDAVPPPVPPSDAVPPAIPPPDAVPVPPPAPPSSPPTESAGEPAGPSLPGLDIPKPKSPPSESRIPIAPSVSVELTWEPVAGATGYLIELEEAVDDAWTPLQRRIVKASRALAQIEPSNPTSATVRWRVRSVVGRRGGRPAPWVVFHLR